jgi:protein JBTS26
MRGERPHTGRPMALGPAADPQHVLPKSADRSNAAYSPCVNEIDPKPLEASGLEPSSEGAAVSEVDFWSESERGPDDVAQLIQDLTDMMDTSIPQDRPLPHSRSIADNKGHSFSGTGLLAQKSTTPKREELMGKYPSLATYNCQVVTLIINSTWGDDHFVGLCGLELLDSKLGVVETALIDSVRTEPKDLSVLGCYDDLRVAENVLNGINDTTNDAFMWLAPFTAGSSNYVEIVLREDVLLAGLRIWNYNKAGTDNLIRGAKRITVMLDRARTVGDFLCRIGCGLDGVSSGQLVVLSNIAAPLPTTMPHGNFSASEVLNGVVAAPSRLKQEYEVPNHPSGMLWRITLLENWNDGYYIGLDRIELYDGNGVLIDIEKSGAFITAVPHSLQDLIPLGSNPLDIDRRTPDSLFGDYSHCWLAPVAQSMSVSERLAPAVRVLANQRIVQSFCSASTKERFDAYVSSITAASTKSELVKVISMPRDNIVFILFDYPVAVSAIRLTNYSKTPSRGVKEFTIDVDGRLVYAGTLLPWSDDSTGGGAGPQAVIFSQDPKIVEAHRDVTGRHVIREQDVLYINEKKVIVRSKSTHNVANAANEGIIFDLTQRPATSLHT